MRGSRLEPLIQAWRGYLERPYASTQLILFAGLGLLAFGVMMATSTTVSASMQAGSHQTMWSQLTKEIEFLVLSVPVFWLAVWVSPRVYRRLAYPAITFGGLVLLATLTPGVGVMINGARRWIMIGPLQFQPSEFVKLAVLLWGADLLARKQHFGTLTRAKHLFVPLIPGFAFVCALVVLEPDLGTTLCFLLILLGLLWTIGTPLRYFAMILIGVAASVGALAVAAPYRLQRLTTFTDPFAHAQTSGYHTVEGLYALASGGIFGVGLGAGTSKYSWVPNANTDYVFAVIGEELGLIGCVVVLALFALFAFTGLRISRRSADPFVRLAAGAATVWITGQAVINIGYVTGLLPVTGIPLPFISAGGTSLIATAIVFGMLVSFARHEPAAVAAARAAAAAARRPRVERWLRIRVPAVYVEPKRKPRPARPSAAPARVPVRAAPPRGRAPRVQRTGQGRAPSTPAAATDGHRGAAPRRPMTAARRPVSVVVAGGHSAGHIEPALAVADAVRRLDHQAMITALGSVRGLDTTLIPARGYPLELIPPVPLPRKVNRALLETPLKLRRAVRAARAVLDRVEADVVVGFGGYVALPAYLAARRAGVPIVVHEANARAGVANRVGARLTKHVFTASTSVRLPHAQAVGIPLRPQIAHLDRIAERPAARARFGLDDERPVLMVTGGSQGAQAINAAVAAAARAVVAAGVQVLHIIGPKNALASELGDLAGYVGVPFVEQMASAYAAADFVLCRSGAMTCAELTAVGLPAAYVPLPLRGGEQRHNAEPIVAAGAALLVDNADLSPEWIIDNVVPCITDPARLAAMSAAARHAGSRDADVVLARAVLTIADEHRRAKERR